MPVYFDKAHGRWRYSFRRRIGGQRYQITRLLPAGWSRAQAEQYDRQESGRIYAEATGIKPVSVSLAGAVQLYLEHRIPKLKDGKKIAQDLAHLFDDIANANLEQLPDVARDYIKANSHLSDGTLHNRLAYLRAAVNYARRHHGYGKGLPDYTKEMIVPVPQNQRQTYARMPELDRLWAAFDDPEARALFRLAFHCGLRWRAELLTRTEEHITKNGRDVWLEIGTTKNGSPVMKPVHPEAHDDLKWIPWSRGDSAFYAAWHKAVAAIGRPDLRPHDLRHSLASAVASTPGGTLDDVRAALHHKSLQAADRYTHLYPEAAKRILFGVGKRLHTSRKKKAAPKERKVA